VEDYGNAFFDGHGLCGRNRFYAYIHLDLIDGRHRAWRSIGFRRRDNPQTVSRYGRIGLDHEHLWRPKFRAGHHVPFFVIPDFLAIDRVNAGSQNDQVEVVPVSWTGC